MTTTTMMTTTGMMTTTTMMTTAACGSDSCEAQIWMPWSRPQANGKERKNTKSRAKQPQQQLLADDRPAQPAAKVQPLADVPVQSAKEVVQPVADLPAQPAKKLLQLLASRHCGFQ